jgi:hypothetical protein
MMRVGDMGTPGPMALVPLFYIWVKAQEDYDPR